LTVSRTLQLALAALALVILGGIAAAIAVAVRGSDQASPVVTNSLSVTPSNAPPRGALVLASEAGSRAVALAVGKGRLTATVLAPSGSPESGLSVSFRADNRETKADTCGAGCYTAAVPRAARVEVLLGSGSPVSFRLPARARPGGSIVARASRVFRGLKSVEYVESLRSTPKRGLVTTWRMQAPDRVAYRIDNGASAVVIGTRRWDRQSPGAAWRKSEQEPKLSVPAPAWGDRAVNAHVLGTATVDGRPVWVVSFVNPTVPAWFTAWIDRSSYRTLRLRMTAASHFMFHRYVEFNKPVGIAAPK
jgi:hypothetical protein